MRSRHNLKYMSIAIVGLVASILATPSMAAYSLTWSDEFAGDLSKWTHQVGDGCSIGICGWGNKELQYYTNGSQSKIVSDPDATDGKALQITLTQEGAGNYNCYYGTCKYISSRINSKAYFQYGRLEVRAKHQQADGFWPAAWHLGQSYRSNSTPWPNCGEIDVIEQRNLENRTYGTFHWATATGSYTSAGGAANASPTTYQVYSILWTPQAMTLYYNGSKYYSLDITDGKNSTEEFHNPFFMLLNFAACSTETGFCRRKQATAHSGTYLIDYVRLYQDKGIPNTSCTNCN